MILECGSMETARETDVKFEVRHVLFIDIVGYSRLSINEQHAAFDELTQIARPTEQFKKAEEAVFGRVRTCPR